MTAWLIVFTSPPIRQVLFPFLSRPTSPWNILFSSSRALSACRYSEHSTGGSTRLSTSHCNMFYAPGSPNSMITAKLINILMLLTTRAEAITDSLPGALPLLFTSNLTTNSSAQAPYFRNVSAGEVWVVPSDRYDIGGRGMSCECFNPDGKQRPSLSYSNFLMLMSSAKAKEADLR